MRHKHEYIDSLPNRPRFSWIERGIIGIFIATVFIVWGALAWLLFLLVVWGTQKVLGV